MAGGDVAYLGSRTVADRLLGSERGGLGALVGIGGGIIIVPALVLAFRAAVAASLIAVIATSTTAGRSMWVRDLPTCAWV